MSTYLITGATGFLGHHLVPALLDAGHTLVALTRRPAPALEAQGVQVVIGDVCDAESVKKAAKGCDGLFHCAQWRAGKGVETDGQGTLAIFQFNVRPNPWAYERRSVKRQ